MQTSIAHRRDRIFDLELPSRPGTEGTTVRQADLRLLGKAPSGFLDTTHFDTVRFPPPPWAAGRFADAANDGALAYSGYRGNADVLDDIAPSISGFIGVPVSASENLLLTPGTQGGLFATFGALVNSGDRVALLDPDYLFNERILRFLGASPCPVRLVFDSDDPHPDFAELEAAFAGGVRLFAFSNPNNPTGAVFSGDVVLRICALAQRYDVTLVIDELYSRLVHDGPFTHAATQEGMFERCVTLLGPSKTESLSGYRLGVVVCGKALASRVENVLSVTALRAPAYAQHILIPWLRDDHDWLRGRLNELRALRAMTLDKLRELDWLKVRMQRGTAYAWVDFSALGTAGDRVAERLLTQAGVLVSPGYQFGPASGACFRVCYARDEATWAEALKRMVRALAELKD